MSHYTLKSTIGIFARFLFTILPPPYNIPAPLRITIILLSNQPSGKERRSKASKMVQT
jgi:hypothetical protein